MRLLDAKTAPVVRQDVGAADHTDPFNTTWPASRSQCPDCGSDLDSYADDVYTYGPEPVPSHTEVLTVCTRRTCTYTKRSVA